MTRNEELDRITEIPNGDQLTVAYETSHIRTADLLDRLQGLMADLPSPDGDVNWGHVGTLTDVNNRLNQIVETLESVTNI